MAIKFEALASSPLLSLRTWFLVGASTARKLKEAKDRQAAELPFVF